VTKLLLSIHVLAAIIAIGPVTVAAGMFPAATRRALAQPADQRGFAVLRNLHRICRVYAALGVLVPVFGLATASSLGVLTDPWLIISMVLTVVAAGMLALLVLPGQAAILDGENALASTTTHSGETGGQLRTATADRPSVPVQRLAVRLGVVTGIFNLLWAVVVVLMIVRPGSTTGA
jgi:hypothetical protein